MEISKLEFMEAKSRYMNFVGTLPPDQSVVMPTFEWFLSPGIFRSWQLEKWRPGQPTDCIELSVEAESHWEMINSTHYKTLMKVYVLQRIDNHPRK